MRPRHFLFLAAAFAAAAALAPALALAQAVETGIASWYGADFHGRKTANGELYDKEKLTAAHRTLPFGTYLRVTSLDNGSSVVVRVNDRGPFAKNRVIDLSEAAARIIGMIPTGTASVSLKAIPKEEALAWRGGSIDGSESTEPGGAAAASEPARATATKAQAPGARVRIQVASYANEANARATLERLALSGMEARIERAGSRFRVAFPDLSVEESRTMSLRLDGLGYRGYTVTVMRPAAKP